MLVDQKKKEIIIKIPLTSAKGKVRIKWRVRLHNTKEGLVIAGSAPDNMNEHLADITAYMGLFNGAKSSGMAGICGCMKGRINFIQFPLNLLKITVL